ncbi:MAG: hypothetical protein ACE5E8_08090 [Acidimicrobiia bacterium]
MATVAIVGDGPGGLSGALFLAKAGHETAVFGTDETVMRHAYLYSYLGIHGMSGSSFQAGAGATAALDILAREAGKDVQDWDSPPEDDEG